MTTEVLIVSGPFACYVKFDGNLVDDTSRVLDTAAVWRRFKGQKTTNLLRWLNTKFGEVTIHSLDPDKFFCVKVPQ